MGKTRGSKRFVSWLSWFCSRVVNSGDDKSVKNLKPSSGSGAMMGAAKHFSSAHKINFD
jgi:hypothetical protein